MRRVFTFHLLYSRCDPFMRAYDELPCLSGDTHSGAWRHYFEHARVHTHPSQYHSCTHEIKLNISVHNAAAAATKIRNRNKLERKNSRPEITVRGVNIAFAVRLWSAKSCAIFFFRSLCGKMTFAFYFSRTIFRTEQQSGFKTYPSSSN